MDSRTDKENIEQNTRQSIEQAKKEKKENSLFEHLENLAEYTKNLWHFLPLALCYLDSNGFILEVNQTFEKTFSWKLSEIFNKPLNFFMSEKEALKVITQALQEKEIINEEMNFLTKKGEKVPVSVYSRARKNNKGNVVGLFLALTDIRETKKFQDKLKQKIKEKTKELEEKVIELEKTKVVLLNILEDVEEARKKVEEEKNKTQAIITNLTDGLMFFDQEKKLSLINRQAEEFFEIKNQQLIGQTLLELSKNFKFKLLRELIGEEIDNVFRKELKIKENLILEVTAIPLTTKKEKTGNLVILHDVTREKLIEKMKTEFVALSAHQLRTPLSTIKWILRMLLDEELGKINDQQKEFLNDGYQSNERMISLINDLLNVTRIEEGRYVYNLTPTDIIGTIQSVINSHQEEIKGKKLKVIFNKPKSKTFKVRVDAEKIRMVIDNIIDNAIKYSLLNGEILISLKYYKDKLKFSVKDNGIGIPQFQKERVFTKFFRGINAVKRETDGTGLGLFIAKNIIEAHKGSIWFESEEGKGTTFYFTLPLK